MNPAAAIEAASRRQEATLQRGFAQVAAGGAALQRSVDGGFAQVGAQLGHIALTQEQLVAQSARQLSELEAMRTQQAQHFLAEQQRREHEQRLQALYARAAEAIHDALLALRAMGRELEAAQADLPSIWLRVFEIERSTRGLDPSRVDPAQRRDLLELRDAIARTKEGLQQRAADAGRMLERWLGLEWAAMQRERHAGELQRHVAGLMASENPSWAPPSTVADAEGWVAAAQREVDELQASYPEPLPSVTDTVVRDVLKGFRPGAPGDPEKERQLGLEARAQLLRLEANKYRLPVQFRWGAAGIGVAFALLFGLSIGLTAVFAGLGLAQEQAVNIALAVAFVLAVALPSYGSYLAMQVERAGRNYHQWAWSSWSRREAALRKLADAQALHHALSQLEGFRSDPQGGGALGELQGWRADLRGQVVKVALLS